MKTKGIPFWEQYLEYLVLGAAVIALLVFAAMQFIGSPNVIDVAGTKVGPGEVDKLLEDKAATIAERIRGSAMELESPTPLSEVFEAKRAAGVSPVQTLALVEPRISPLPPNMRSNPDRPFVVAQVPAPYNIVTRQYFDTLSEETVSQHEELRKVVAAAAPYDVSWITVAAMFDVQSVLQQFNSAGPNGEAPLPPAWTNNRVDYIDVKIEREEYVGGKWVQSTLLQPIPGQVSVRADLGGGIDAGKRNEILAIVAPDQGLESLIRPEFYTGAAAAWAPPDAAPKQVMEPNAAPEDNELKTLRGRHERLKKEIERVLTKMKAINCTEQAPTPPPSTGGSGSGQRSGGGSSEIMGGGGGTLRDPNQKKNEAECNTLRKKLRALRIQSEATEAAIRKLSPDEPPPAPEPTQDEAPAPLPQDKIMIWGHDITVQPGKTYRYRMVVEVFNPLFARKLDLMPAQQPMAEQFTLVSKASEWTQPIIAEPPLRFFVTSAKSAAQQQGVLGAALGSASIEVYRFRDGRWWSNTFANVQPGERVGNAKSIGRGEDKSTVDYSTDWFVLDVVADVAPEAADDVSRGFAATVLLQSTKDPAMVQMRSARGDFVSAERSFLKQEATSAASPSGEVASSQ